MNRKEIGDVGEAFVADWMQKEGYSILKTNYYTPYGEIDIIASRDPYIVFVEVRTRREGGLVTPVESVTKAKRKRMLYSVYHYLMGSECELQPRIDVVEVFTKAEDGKTILRMNYIDNAFGEEG